MKLRAVFVIIVLVSASPSANELKDPTRPPGELPRVAGKQSQSAALPKLASVLVAPGRRVAVIDGESFVEGETHGAVTVRKIEHDWVDVAVAGRGDFRLLLLIPGLTKDERSR